MNRVLVVGWLAWLAACGSRHDPAPAPDPTKPTPLDALEPAKPKPPPGLDAVPKEPGPIEPLSRLRPLMKKADAIALLAEAKAKRIATPNADELTYETAISGVKAQLWFKDGRLWRIGFTESRRVKDALVAPVLARWGNGTTNDDHGSTITSHRWPASPSGWVVSLDVVSELAEFFETELTLTIEPNQVTTDTMTATSEIFPQLAKLLGRSLDDARQQLGPAFQLETADTEDAAAEAGSDAGRAKQGHARVKVPWGDEQWELVVHVDPKTNRISDAVLTGQPGNEAARLALLTALKAAFGAPRPVVSDAGRIELELAAGGVVARIPAVGDDVTITIRR